MIKRSYKLIISVVLVTTLFLCGTVSAFAEPAWLIRAKAGLAAASLASQLFLTPIDYAFDNAVAQAIDPLAIVTTVSEKQWNEYLDRSVIKVTPDSVTIGGVKYSDIWLGPDAAASLRTSLGDFITAYNLLTEQNSNVIYATGYGYAGQGDTVPVYLLPGNNVRSPLYHIGYGSTTIAGVGVSIADNSSTATSNKIIVSLNNPYGTSSQKSMSKYSYNFVGVYGSQIKGSYGANSCSLHAGFLTNNNYNSISTSTGDYTSVSSVPLVQSPFEFDYTSGTEFLVPQSNEGLLLRVPSTYDDGQGHTYDIPDFVDNNPGVDQTGGRTINIDPSLNPDADVDIKLGNDLGDLINTIMNLMDLLKDVSDIRYSPEPDPEPEPSPEPPLPDPDVPISDQDPTWLDSLLRWIQQTIDSIKTVGETIHQDIQDLAETLSDLPETILEDIEQAPIKVYQKALDLLKTVFAPIIALLRSVIGLWHYVVEWVTNTAPVFSSFFSLMSSTSYNMVLPIYASLAGVIVIAVYKRFGK